MGNARDYEFLARELIADRDNRVVISLDFPGRGKSERLRDAEDYQYSTYIATFMAVYQKESPHQKVDLIDTREICSNSRLGHRDSRWSRAWSKCANKSTKYNE
eukprot:gene11540-13472_t